MDKDQRIQELEAELAAVLRRAVAAELTLRRQNMWNRNADLECKGTSQDWHWAHWIEGNRTVAVHWPPHREGEPFALYWTKSGSPPVCDTSERMPVATEAQRLALWDWLGGGTYEVRE